MTDMGGKTWVKSYVRQPVLWFLESTRGINLSSYVGCFSTLAVNHVCFYFEKLLFKFVFVIYFFIFYYQKKV